MHVIPYRGHLFLVLFLLALTSIPLVTNSQTGQSQDECSTASEAGEGTVTNDCIACITVVENGKQVKKKVGAICKVTGGGDETKANCVPGAVNNPPPGNCRTEYCVGGKCFKAQTHSQPSPQNIPRTPEQLSRLYSDLNEAGVLTTPISDSGLTSDAIFGGQDTSAQTLWQQSQQSVFDRLKNLFAPEIGQSKGFEEPLSGPDLTAGVRGDISALRLSENTPSINELDNLYKQTTGEATFEAPPDVTKDPAALAQEILDKNLDERTPWEKAKDTWENLFNISATAAPGDGRDFSTIQKAMERFFADGYTKEQFDNLRSNPEAFAALRNHMYDAALETGRLHPQLQDRIRFNSYMDALMTREVTVPSMATNNPGGAGLHQLTPPAVNDVFGYNLSSSQVEGLWGYKRHDAFKSDGMNMLTGMQYVNKLGVEGNQSLADTTISYYGWNHSAAQRADYWNTVSNGMGVYERGYNAIITGNEPVLAINGRYDATSPAAAEWKGFMQAQSRFIAPAPQQITGTFDAPAAVYTPPAFTAETAPANWGITTNTNSYGMPSASENWSQPDMVTSIYDATPFAEAAPQNVASNDSPSISFRSANVIETPPTTQGPDVLTSNLDLSDYPVRDIPPPGFFTAEQLRATENQLPALEPAVFDPPSDSPPVVAELTPEQRLQEIQNEIDIAANSQERIEERLNTLAQVDGTRDSVKKALDQLRKGIDDPSFTADTRVINKGLADAREVEKQLRAIGETKLADDVKRDVASLEQYQRQVSSLRARGDQLQRQSDAMGFFTKLGNANDLISRRDALLAEKAQLLARGNTLESTSRATLGRVETYVSNNAGTFSASLAGAQQTQQDLFASLPPAYSLATIAQTTPPVYVPPFASGDVPDLPVVPVSFGQQMIPQVPTAPSGIGSLPPLGTADLPPLSQPARNEPVVASAANTPSWFQTNVLDPVKAYLPETIGNFVQERSDILTAWGRNPFETSLEAQEQPVAPVRSELSFPFSLNVPSSEASSPFAINIPNEWRGALTPQGSLEDLINTRGTENNPWASYVAQNYDWEAITPANFSPSAIQTGEIGADTGAVATQPNITMFDGMNRQIPAAQNTLQQPVSAPDPDPAPFQEVARAQLPIQVPPVGNATNPYQVWGSSIPPVAERRALYEQLAAEGLVPRVDRYAGTEKQNWDLVQGLRMREQNPAAPDPQPVPNLYQGAQAGYKDGPSIVDFMRAAGQPSDFASRAQLANRFNIPNYRGTAAQNLQLIGFLRSTFGVQP